MSDSWFLYIIETQRGRLYTGITTDVERRFKQHSEGKGAKFFRSDAPVKVVYSEAHSDKGAALRAEYQTKQLTRAQKLQLIAAGKRPLMTFSGCDSGSDQTSQSS